MSVKTSSIDVLRTPIARANRSSHATPTTIIVADPVSRIDRSMGLKPKRLIEAGRVRRFAGQAFAAACLVVAGTNSAWAIATQTGPTLEVRGTAAPDSIEIEVGPVAGQVTLFGVDGVPDGQTFNGVADLIVSTFSGNDSVNFFVESADVSISVDTAGGSDSVTVGMVTPPGMSQASALFAFDTGISNDTVEVNIESFASQLEIGMSFTRAVSAVETAKIEVQQQVSGNVAIDLAGSQAFTFENFSLNATGPAVFALNGEIRSQETKVEIDGDAAGNVQLTGEVFPSNIEYFVKGLLNGSPSIIANSGFSNTLKLLAEGGIVGTPLIDGRIGGFTDSCEGSPGVLIINCF